MTMVFAARCAVPSRNMASNSALVTARRSGARRRGRQVTGRPGVMQMLCKVLCRTLRLIPVGLVSSGNSARRLSAVVSLVIVFMLGTDVCAARPGVESDVTPSTRRLFLQSMRRP